MRRVASGASPATAGSMLTVAPASTLLSIEQPTNTPKTTRPTNGSQSDSNWSSLGFVALRILAGSDGVEEGPVGFAGVEQRPDPVVGESSEPEGGAFDAFD